MTQCQYCLIRSDIKSLVFLDIDKRATLATIATINRIIRVRYSLSVSTMITTTFTAKEAKNNFGRLLDEARRFPVFVKKNGRRVAVVMSVERYAVSEPQRSGSRVLDEIERSYQELLWRQKELEADADIKAGRYKTYRTVKELKRALDKLKK